MPTHLIMKWNCSYYAAGSWSETCAASSYNVSSGILSAVCSGNTFNSYINYNLCVAGSDVINESGVLTCAQVQPMLPGWCRDESGRELIRMHAVLCR